MPLLQLACPSRAESSVRSTAAALYDLTKPRLAAMSVLSAVVAYATAGPKLGATHAALMVLGTTLAAAGALSLNQWWERGTDAVMLRTRTRPLPQAQLAPGVALGWSMGLSLAGVALLATTINALTAALAAATIVTYGLVYTPLKRRSRWATEIGSVSGALPALLGNAAAGDVFARPGLVLTAILLLWQMPHFFAIGWKHRADYRRAGFPLLPAIDASGDRTARWSFGYALGLLVVSAAPWPLGWLGAGYGVVAAVAGAWFAHAAWRFLAAAEARDLAARRLFLTSILYLPVVMAALVVERFLAAT